MSSTMTEEEAKKKWCPFYRVTSYEKSNTYPAWTSNRGVHWDCEINPEDSLCIGSKCMSWQWVQERYTRPGGDPFANDSFKPLRNTDKGYCGLARKS